MKRTRRQVLRAGFAGAAGLAFSGSVRLLDAQSNTPQARGAASGVVEQLADDLFVIRLPGEQNVVAQRDARGVLLVDGGSAAASASLLKVIAGLPGSGPVHTLFNTHWHPEQTGLNEYVGKAGNTIIAHENTRLWLTTDVVWPWNGRRFTRLPKVAQPNRTFYRTGKLDSGVEYGYIPDAAHTDGDIYVNFPRHNVLAVGDVVSLAGWPQVDWTSGGWIGGMVGGAQRLATIAGDQTRIVPSRGPLLSLADLKTQLAMYGTIYERLTQLLNKGRGPSEAVEAKPASEFEAQMGNSDEFVRRAFESLWAYLSPDA